MKKILSVFVMFYMVLGVANVASAWHGTWSFEESCTEEGTIDVSASYDALDDLGGTVKYTSDHLDLKEGDVVTVELVEDGGQNAEYTVTNENDCQKEEDDTATISAVKIVCDTEADLPNWGAGGADITSSTASDFLETHPNCELADWTFEWAPNGTANPGDNEEEGGDAWTAFSGSTSVPSGAKIWVREQFMDGYVPFSGATSNLNDTESKNSAELYCSTDVLNYDNYDWIDPVLAGQTYNCIGFNALLEQEEENASPVADAGPDQIITLPVNQVTLDASGSSDSDGTIASYVWTFVSGPSNIDPADSVNPNVSGLVAGTYVFELTVTDNDGATDTDTVQITVNPEVVGNPQCSDDADNDGDQLVDENDPGCHTDGNPGNPESYNPNDNDETNAQCSDGVDNTDSEDTLVDSTDPGCHTDGNVNNSGSYNPGDNDEANTSTECSDGVNNDEGEDSLIDSNDPDCHTDGDAGNPESYDPSDDKEAHGALPQCSDGKDNDGDGEIDYGPTKDQGCDSPSDDDETGGDNGGGGGGGSRRSGSRSGQVLGEQTSCGIYVDKFLRKGLKTNNVEAVKKVQTFLNDYMHESLTVDGIYGSKTEAAVNRFQLTYKDKILTPWGISAPTGIFYLTTQTEVNNIMCPPLNLPIPSNLINFQFHPQTPKI